MADPDRQHIAEDLSGLVRGDVFADDVHVQMYASDASNYQIIPLCVVRPVSTDDVAAVVKYAAEHRISVHARGAGTGLAGESLGSGIVIDFACHMRRVLRTDYDQITVQPGLVHERLNAFLRKSGRQFGPDPATSHVTTMGSVVSVDGSGSRFLVHGSTRRHVQRLSVVLADGTVLDVGREPLVDGVSRDPIDRKRELINQLVDVLRRDADLIRKHQPKSLVNRSGYHLLDVLGPTCLDLPRLLTGSEGTLALFTEITLATQPLPRHSSAALLFFESLDKAARAVSEIQAFRPSACDLMDRRHLSLAREKEPRYDGVLPETAEALLFVEVEGNDVSEVRDRMRQLVERVRHRRRLAFDSRIATGDEELRFFWLLARKTTPTLLRLKGSTRALPFVEDFAIPPDALSKTLVELQNILKRHQVTATLFAHAGHGQLHLRPFLDLSDPGHIRTMEALAEDIYTAVWNVGGTISGEHADGLSRSSFVERQYGDLYRTFRDVKRIFDPHNIFNPGKVITDQSDLLTLNLRPRWGTDLAANAAGITSDEPAAVAKSHVVPLQLNWRDAELEQAARACNGCGACRSQSSEVRMCPIFRFLPAEEASPRAKANLMRSVLSGQISPDTIQSQAFKEVADLCVNCKMCRLECPAGVDIPKMMIEAKAAYVAHDGLRFGDWVLTRLDLFSSLGNYFSPLANWAISNRQMRWFLEKTLGLAQGRKLPRFAPRSFIRWAHRRRLTRPPRRSGRKVLCFVDTFANYHDPALAEALVRILEHNGVPVYVPPGQTQSGMAMVSIGAVERAKRVARYNVSLLAESVRQGFTIVTTEPSAAVCLKQEYPAMLDDDDTRLVADNTVEACTYLWNMHQEGQLQLDLKPLRHTLAYHAPCHMIALGADLPGANLLRLIPGLIVQHIERGCSGMAGLYGLKRQNYRNSLRAGWPLISQLRDGQHHAGTTECSSCRIQMEQSTTKPTVHPLKILALAYGLMPEVAAMLSERGKERSIT